VPNVGASGARRQQQTPDRSLAGMVEPERGRPSVVLLVLHAEYGSEQPASISIRWTATLRS